MKLSLKFIAAACLVATATAAVILWIAFSRAKQENRVLAARILSANNDAEREPQINVIANMDLARLRQETREIHQLRNEITQLRDVKQELERLRNENSQLREIIDAEKGRIQAQWAAWVSLVRTNGMKPADVSYLVYALTNDATPVRLEATKALRQIGLQRLLNTNLTTRATLELRKAAQIAIPGLVAALGDSDPFVRANSAITLGLLNEEPDVVVPALLGSLHDEQDRVALSAAKALGRLRSDAKDALPELLRAAQGAHQGLREVSIQAIKQIDPEFARNERLQ